MAAEESSRRVGVSGHETQGVGDQPRDPGLSHAHDKSERVSGDRDGSAHVSRLDVVVERSAHGACRPLELVRLTRGKLGVAKADEQRCGLIVHRLLFLRSQPALEVGERLLVGIRGQRRLPGAE